MAWARERDVDVGIVRIFNTYGPRLREGDGQVVSNFIVQALTGRPLTVYGDGRHTRSLCYQSDLVSGLVAMLDARGVTGPVNLGNPAELTVLELASLLLDATGSSSEVVHLEAVKDDPTRRKPDITRAGELLGWAPRGDSGRPFAEHDQLVRRPPGPRDPAEVMPTGSDASQQAAGITEPVSVGGATS
jgi:dTDP-glucose 4,6-dehydratase